MCVCVYIYTRVSHAFTICVFKNPKPKKARNPYTLGYIYVHTLHL